MISLVKALNRKIGSVRFRGSVQPGTWEGWTMATRAKRKQKPDPWPDWQARGLTLPDDAELERLSQPDGVASVGSRPVPIDTEPKEGPR